jgi:hypothetical protein
MNDIRIFYTDKINFDAYCLIKECVKIFDTSIFPGTSDYLSWDYIYTINRLFSSQIDSLRDVLNVNLPEVDDCENLSHCLLMCRVFDPYLNADERQQNLDRCARAMLSKLGKIGFRATPQPGTITTGTFQNDFLNLFTNSVKSIIINMPQSNTLSLQQKQLINASMREARKCAQKIRSFKNPFPILSHMLVYVNLFDHWTQKTVRRARPLMTPSWICAHLIIMPVAVSSIIQPKVVGNFMTAISTIYVVGLSAVQLNSVLSDAQRNLRLVHRVKTPPEFSIEESVKILEYVMQNFSIFFPQQNMPRKI